MEMNVYVGTYAKYNNGSIFGRWMNLCEYSSKQEFLEACQELHSDEKDPEFMFQDYEYIPERMIGESFIDERIWDVIEQDWDDEQLERFSEYMDATGCNIEAAIQKSQDNFIGEFDSYYDLGFYMAHDMDCIKIPESLECYFDYEKYGREMSWDLLESGNKYWWN